MFTAKITGLGKCLPKKVVSNFDLEKMMDTSDEWIRQRSGIIERRWAQSGETTASMGYEAALGALKDAGRTANDVDAIIFATITPDYYFPGCAVLVQEKLCPDRYVAALDIRNQCSAFVYATSVADAWIRTGQYKCVLVIGGEVQTTGMDLSPEGRDVGVLFGDGAGAVLMEQCKPGETGFKLHKLHSEGKFAESLMIEEPNCRSFPQRFKKGTMEIGRGYFPTMEGRMVFKHAVTRMCEVITEACEAAKVQISDIDFVIAHQANMRINQMVLEQLKIPLDRTYNTLQHYGNTTAATIPITMCEASEKGLIKKGMLVANVAFGSGFAWGASLQRWEK